VLLWVAALLVPAAAGWAREAFAASSLLWLFPTKPLRLPRPPSDEPA